MATSDFIKTGFEDGTFYIMDIPIVFEANVLLPSGVYVHKDGLHLDEAKCFEDSNWVRDRIVMPTMNTSGGGEYELTVGRIRAEHFKSREDFDFLFYREWSSNAIDYPDNPGINLDQVSFKEALKLMEVDIYCNMDFFLANRDEMERELGRKLPSNLEDKDLLKQIEEELFYKQSVKIFGHEEDYDEKSAVTFTDFRVLYIDGNARFATARHGKHFLNFDYVTG